MPYALVRGARNTLRPPVVRWRRRGLGQDSGDVCDPSSSSYDDLECANETGGPLPSGGGETPTTNPLAGNTSLPPTGVMPAAIGSNVGCAAGYVVADNSGNCAPASSLAATLSTPAGASSLGLTAAQAAAITASLNAATTAVKVATGQPVVTPVVAASSNPFASISPTTLMIGAVALVALLLVMKKH